MVHIVLHFHYTPVHPWLIAGQSTSIGLTAVVSGGGPGSASAFIDSNPPPPPSDPYTLDTILILRLEDGADVFISLRGTYLPSCFGTDLDRLLTLGDGPVVAVEQLGPEGQQLLQQGLQPPALPGDLAQQGQGQDLQEQVAALGLGGGGDPAAAAAAAAAGCSDGGGRSKADLMRRKSMTGVEAHVPKEIQRLVQFLKVSLQTRLVANLLLVLVLVANLLLVLLYPQVVVAVVCANNVFEPA